MGAVLYNVLTRRELSDLNEATHRHPRHRWHHLALLVPMVVFVALYFLPSNPIYPSIVAMAAGAIATALCRPALASKTILGAVLFLSYYALFVTALVLFAPGYDNAVWNLRALTGVRFVSIPLEELLFGFVFGVY